MRLDDVSFSYPSRPDIPVLKDVNLNWRPEKQWLWLGRLEVGSQQLLPFYHGFMTPKRARLPGRVCSGRLEF